MTRDERAEIETSEAIRAHKAQEAIARKGQKMQLISAAIGAAGRIGSKMVPGLGTIDGVNDVVHEYVDAIHR